MGNVSVSRAYKRNLPLGSACFTGIWLLLFTGNIWFDSDAGSEKFISTLKNVIYKSGIYSYKKVNVNFLLSQSGIKCSVSYFL